MIELNKKAPNFSLPDKNNEQISLDQIKSKYTIIYFYPKDNTPGCTIEAIEFSTLQKEFEKANTTIIGISGGNEKTKTTFCNKHKLTIPLLSDTEFIVSKKYDVYGEKKFMGRLFNGIKRTTFILDSEKKIIAIFDKVNVKDHATEVLDWIKKHQTTSN